MTAPSLAAARFGVALLMGGGLGLIYGFLRPLRPRLTTLADLIFVGALSAAWLYLSFAVCQGDIRLGYTAGLGLGAMLWELTAGRLLRPVFAIIWLPFQKIFHFFCKFLKKLFASIKKWVTIYKQNHAHKIS